MESKLQHIDKETYRKAIIEMTKGIENAKSLKKIYDYISRNIKRAGN